MSPHSSAHPPPPRLWRLARALILVTLLTAMGSVTALAQSGEPASTIAFDHVALGGAFANVEAYAILQDDQGLMWFGTSDGLTRFDGHSRLEYAHDLADPTSIAGGGVYALAQDRGTPDWLWIGGGQGLTRFDRRSRTFTRYGDSPTGAVMAIAQAPNGRLWIGGDGGLASLDADTHTLRADSRVTTSVRALCLDETAGRLWVGGDGGLTRVDAWGVTNFRAEPGNPISLSSNRVSAIEPDGRGNLWIGTDAGLDWFDASTEQFTHSLPTPDQASQWVNGLVRDRSGVLWVATRGGLYRLDSVTGSFVRYSNDPLEPSSLGSDFVNALYVDRTGTIWLAPRNKAIDKFNPDRQFFEIWHGQRGILSVAAGRDGVLWLASGGLERYDIATGRVSRFTHDPANPDSLSDNTINALLEDTDGTVWVGTDNVGLDRFDPASGTFRHYTAVPSGPTGLRSNQISALLEDRFSRHVLWIGTVSGGITRFDTSSGEGRTYVHDALDSDSLAGNTVNGLAQDAAGVIWIGTTDGLSRFDAGTHRFATFRASPDKPDGLTSSNIRFIEFDPNGQLWLATAGGGLNHFDPRAGTATAYSQREGLPYYSIRAMQADLAGNLWLANSGWIAKFDPRTNTITNFDRRYGVRSGTEFPFGAMARGADGRIFFGSDKGLITFAPERVTPKTEVPPVVLTDFQLYGRSVEMGATSILRQAIDHTSLLTLTYADQVFGFSFAALDYEDPNRIRYAYRMDGLSDTWIEVDSSVRAATFTGLRPGNYVFHVKATNSDGIWNEIGTSIAVTITPPWWETDWFRGSVLIALLGGTFAAYRLRIRAVDARSRELESEVAQRTAELTRASQAKSEFLANMSHELRTPLNSILGYAQLLQRPGSSAPPTSTGVATIYQSGQHLLTLIDDLLDLARIEARRLELRPTDVSLVRLLDEVAEMVGPAARDKRLHFTAAVVGGAPGWISVDAVRLRQVLLNLLGNAIKFTEHGSVTLTAECQSSSDEACCRIRFTVCDTGSGIAQEHLDRIFRRFEQVGDPARRRPGVGLGLALSQDLVELMGGRIAVDSALGRGTTFSFDLQVPVVASTSLPGAPDLWRNVRGYTGPRRTVLVADDQAHNRAVLRDLLEPVGFDVLVAEDGQRAVDLARDCQPDLILIDLLMPTIGGLDAVRLIRQMPRHANTPIVAVSASTFGEDQERSRLAGCDAFQAKPIDADQLFALLASRLELDWTYGGDHASEPDVVPPPQEELQQLSQLARFGNMRRLAERLHSLERMDQAYAPFARQLEALVQNLEDDEIIAFIERFRARVASAGASR